MWSTGQYSSIAVRSTVVWRFYFLKNYVAISSVPYFRWMNERQTLAACWNPRLLERSWNTELVRFDDVRVLYRLLASGLTTLGHSPSTSSPLSDAFYTRQNGTAVQLQAMNTSRVWLRFVCLFCESFFPHPILYHGNEAQCECSKSTRVCIQCTATHCRVLYAGTTEKLNCSFALCLNPPRHFTLYKALHCTGEIHTRTGPWGRGRGRG